MQKLSLFLRLWFWFSFRHLFSQRLRTLTVILGIALGAAVFTSVRLAINASVDSFSRSVNLLTGKADWVITSPGGRVPDTLVAKIVRNPAVRTASPLLTMYVETGEKSGEVLLLIGLDPILDRPLRDWHTKDNNSSSDSVWITLLSEPYTIVTSSKAINEARAVQDGYLKLVHAHGAHTFRVLGTLEPKGIALVEGGDIAITDISTFQEFTGLYGLVDRIDILLKSNATDNDIEEIRSILPNGTIMERPGESNESGKMMIRSYQLNLSVLSFVSLFVGMFLVYSLVALHATARRHELAILGSIGASPRMLFSLFLAEGAFLGVMGWVAAVPIGSFLVRELLGGISSTITHLFVRVQVDSVVLNPWEITASFLLTIFISVAAASQPARKAMKVQPREALVMLDSSQSMGNSAVGITVLGIILILLVYPLAKFPPMFGIPFSGYIATFFLFSGFSMLSPALMRMIGTSLPPLLRHLAGLPAYLGGRHIRDAGTRISISVGALITAIALFVSLAIMVHSFRETVEQWVNQSISGDIFIRPKMSDINRNREPIPESVATLLRSLEPRADLLPYRRIYLHYGIVPYQFEAIDLDAFLKHARFLLIDGNPSDILPKLSHGEGVLISEVFANQTGLSTGDRYKAQIESVHFDLPILGISRDYRTQGGVVHYSLRHFSEATGDGSWSGVRVNMRDSATLKKDSLIQLKKEILLQCIHQQQSVEVTLGSDLRSEILRIFDETFSVTTVLLIIALFVAALGITTTLTVIVLERSREFHTLIATGASRGQIRSMIVWEAVIMVLTGESLGLACGFILSTLLIFVINRQSFGWTFIYSVDWTSLLLSLPLVLATALVASLPAGELVFKSSSAVVLKERQ